MADRWERVETVTYYFLGLQSHCRGWQQPWNLKMLAPWKKRYDQPRQHFKKQKPYFTVRGISSQSYGFTVVMCGCKSWTIKKSECQRIDAFELWVWKRLLRVPWIARRSNQYILKDWSWILIGRTDAEAETLTLWPTDGNNWLIRKDSDAGKDWGQEEKGMTEDEMARWHHQLDGHEFENAPRVGDGQGSLVCCSPWGHKESDMTEWLNQSELIHRLVNNVSGDLSRIWCDWNIGQ